MPRLPKPVRWLLWASGVLFGLVLFAVLTLGLRPLLGEWVRVTLVAVPVALWCLAYAWTRCRSLVRRWRLARWECLGCGYSLKGNESGICPECGRAVRYEP